MEATSGTIFNPYLSNPTAIQRQEFLLLALFVAGKSARVQQRKLHWFLERLRQYVPPQGEDLSPFYLMSSLQPETLRMRLEFVGAGQYNKLVKAITWLVEHYDTLDLSTCTRDELCQCPGIGMKSASFFLMNTRDTNDIACLDTHVLKWMRNERGYLDAPASTPTSKKKYLEYEAYFLAEAAKARLSPRELDFSIWERYEKA